MVAFPIVSITIFLPFISALIILLLPRGAKIGNIYQKYVAILSCVFTLACSIYMLVYFNLKTSSIQFEEKYLWIESIGVYYHVGIDGISIFLILLTTLISAICIISSLFSVTNKTKEFLICFLFIETGAIGAFCAMDLFLFYVFFEALLIPMYLVIGIWGGENRIYAAIKFFLYTLTGSILFLVAIIYIGSLTKTFNITLLPEIIRHFSHGTQASLWLAIFIAFAVKIPMWPLHTWLPDAHVEAPTTGSVMLAGVLLKLGAYGFVRFLLPMFPLISLEFSSVVIILSIIAIIYGSLNAYAQKDIKKLIAYSSIAHMGYITAGIFSFNAQGIEGALFQMLSHGIISSGLFLVVGVLYERTHTRNIENFGGLAQNMPMLSSVFIILVMGSIGLPGTSGFVGELFSLLGVMNKSFILASLAATGVILGAIYMLILYKNVMLGAIKHNYLSGLKDLSIIETITLIPLAVLVIYLGIVPNAIIKFYKLPVLTLLDFLKN